MTDPRKDAGQRRAEAGQKRRAAAASGELRALQRQAPCAGGAWQARSADSARSVAFGANLRANLVKRGGQELYHLDGIASVTDTPYVMYDFFGEYEEVVERIAFAATLAAGPDVAFLVNHRGVTMARTTNGTLELEMVDDGLHSQAWVNPKRQDVADLVIAVEDKNVDQMSFAFMLEEGWWNDDFTQFRITKLDIDRGDVSAVNYGANPYTSITARSQEILSDVDRLPLGVAREAYARLARRRDVIDLSKLAAPAAEPVVAEARAEGPSQSDDEPKTYRSTIAKYEALLAEDD